MSTDDAHRSRIPAAPRLARGSYRHYRSGSAPIGSSLRRLAIGPFLALTLGCSTAPAPPPTPVDSMAAVVGLDAQELELRAVLLLMSDRLLYEPVAAASAVQGSTELRRLAALTLGRLEEPRALGLLQSLLADDEAAVRRAAVFALGELAEAGVAGAARPLMGMVADSDEEVGRLAVEALAKGRVPLEDVVERLLAAPPDQLIPRLAPSLFRFEGPGVVRWSRQILGSGPDGADSDGVGNASPQLRRWAAYGLARNPRPEGADDLRALLDDADPWVRGWAARALGRVGSGEDLARLGPLLDDAEAGPVIQALRTGRALVTRGEAAAPESWRPRLLSLLDDPRVGVRATAIEAASAWLLDEELGEALSKLGRQGSERERELALGALAGAHSPRAELLIGPFFASESPILRAAAVRAAAEMGPVDLIDRAADDPSPLVRRAALALRLLAADEPQKVAVAALADGDFSVRSAVLDWAAEEPKLSLEILQGAYDRATRDRTPDARLAAVRALAARADSEPLERGAVLLLLEKLAEEGPYLVRRQSTASLISLGQETEPLGSPKSRRDIDVYRQIVSQTRQPRRVILETERGQVELEVGCPEAPLTCLAFLQLVNQGFYDDQVFHRVVPDFVVQGGDPRGDGAGGPGYTLRDEIGLLRYQRGILGMAHSGSHTAGSQFFVTLSDQPHLDGGYTSFGRVVAGLDVLDRTSQGDRLIRAREIVGSGTGGRR